jgi:hypothetical protein
MKLAVTILAAILASVGGSSLQENLSGCEGGKAFIIPDQHLNVLKRICMVRSKMTYDQAEEHCREQGMELLVLENSNVSAAFTGFLKRTYPKRSNWKKSKGLWINGRRTFEAKDDQAAAADEDEAYDFVVGNEEEREYSEEGDCASWYSFAPKQKLLDVDALQWTDAYDGDCLAFIGKKKGYRVSGYRCSKSFYFVCQIEQPSHHLQPPPPPQQHQPPKCPELIESTCDELEQEKEMYKEMSSTCSHNLISLNSELDALKNSYEGLKRITNLKETQILEMASKVAEFEIKFDDLKDKFSRCKH